MRRYFIIANLLVLMWLLMPLGATSSGRQNEPLSSFQQNNATQWSNNSFPFQIVAATIEDEIIMITVLHQGCTSPTFVLNSQPLSVGVGSSATINLSLVATGTNCKIWKKTTLAFSIAHLKGSHQSVQFVLENWGMVR